MEPIEGFAQHLQRSGDLNVTLTSLLLLKFGSLVGPSEELLRVAAEHELDEWFELMKRYQQYPDQDMPQLPGTNLLDWSRSQDVALYFANEQRTGEGAIFICDATATGKTLQVVPVADILTKLRTRMLGGFQNGMPLLFSPKRQIGYERAKNQQAVYFAQLELRLDMLEQWRLQEQEQPDSTILIKLVLPANSVAECQTHLVGKGVTTRTMYPDLESKPLD